MLTHQEFSACPVLAERIADARRETDALFSLVKQSELYERPIRERHRSIFYVGHLEAFDWNLLKGYFELRSSNPEFDRLFAFGIDPIGGTTPNDQPSAWPVFSQVLDYRLRVRQEIDAALAKAKDTAELFQLMNIAIEHRLMHAETLEYMFHQLPYHCKTPLNSSTDDNSTSLFAPSTVTIPSNTVSLGLERGSAQFGWDNEFAKRAVDVPEFSIDKFKITNGQFLEFVESGGYDKPEFWRAADWEWKTKAQIRYPVFWAPSPKGFLYRSMFQEITLPVNAPVYVSHAEASAYSRWGGKSLPTEEEWQLAAEGAKPPNESRILWNPPAVNKVLATGSIFGVEGLYGTGWEWTATEFGPFPGFAPHPAYPGYSANFFDGQHYVLKGGSTRTAACMLRKSFRNWFQPHYQYVYAGFRCVTR